jgi:hypothetical protein
MSRLILYPGALRPSDIADDKILQALALSPTIKQFTFDPEPDLIEADKFQLGAENDEIALDGFNNDCIGGVVSAEYGVTTIFDSGTDTYFKLIADDKFQVNIRDAGEIEDDIPFVWSGRETVAFLLFFDGDVNFYLYHDETLYEFTESGGSPDRSEEDITLKDGRWERIDSFESVSNVVEEMIYLLKGTSLSGGAVESS